MRQLITRLKKGRCRRVFAGNMPYAVTQAEKSAALLVSFAKRFARPKPL